MRTFFACPLLLLAAAGCSSGSPEPAHVPSPPSGAPDAEAGPAGDTAPAASGATPAPAGFYALSTTTLEGAPADLSAYAGQVALVVNVASECGYTKQYAGLQALHEEYADRGLVVLGFPSNEFGGQEPGTPEQIRAFCTGEYAVTFPLFAKLQTQPGPGQSPLYGHLVEATGEAPNWNFCKYLVGRDGTVLSFWRSRTAPEDAALRAAIEQALSG